MEYSSKLVTVKSIWLKGHKFENICSNHLQPTMFGELTSCFSFFLSIINSVLLCWTSTIADFREVKTSFQGCCWISCCISVRSLGTLWSRSQYIVCHGHL